MRKVESLGILTVNQFQPVGEKEHPLEMFIIDMAGEQFHKFFFPSTLLQANHRTSVS